MMREAGYMVSTTIINYWDEPVRGDLVCVCVMCSGRVDEQKKEADELIFTYTFLPQWTVLSPNSSMSSVADLEI